MQALKRDSLSPQVSGFVLVFATQNMGQKTVVEISSDDSDDLDIDMDSEGGKEMETAHNAEKPPDLPGASTNRSEPSSPPITASAASSSSAELRNLSTGTDSCRVQPRPDTSHATSTTSTVIPTSTDTDKPPSPTSSVSHVLAEDSSSDEEDLRNILKAVRKTKSQSVAGEQVVATRAPADPSTTLLLAGIRSVFAEKAKQSLNFFSPAHSNPPKSQAEVTLTFKTPGNTRPYSKRKRSCDPFATHILNIEIETDDVDGAETEVKRRREKNKKRHGKTQDRSCISTSSQTPDANHQQQDVSGQVSTSTATQVHNGQKLEGSGPEAVETTVANGASKRCQSAVTRMPGRPRNMSTEPMDSASDSGERSVNFEQLVAPLKPPNVHSMTICHQPRRSVTEQTPCQRTVINADENDDTVQTTVADVQAPAANTKLPSEPNSRQNTKGPIGVCSRAQASVSLLSDHQTNTSNRPRNRSGCGILSHVSRPRRSQTTQKSLRDANPHTSQSQVNEDQGHIGGRPDKRPVYAWKEATSWNRAVNEAKRQQGEFNRVRKKMTLDKSRSQQFQPPRPDAEARLRKAQEEPGWKKVPLSSSSPMAFKSSDFE